MGKQVAIIVISVWSKTKTKLYARRLCRWQSQPDPVGSSLKLQFQEKSYSSIGIDEHAQITMQCVKINLYSGDFQGRFSKGSKYHALFSCHSPCSKSYRIYICTYAYLKHIEILEHFWNRITVMAEILQRNSTYLIRERYFIPDNTIKSLYAF